MDDIQCSIAEWVLIRMVKGNITKKKYTYSWKIQTDIWWWSLVQMKRWLNTGTGRNEKRNILKNDKIISEINIKFEVTKALYMIEMRKSKGRKNVEKITKY